MRVFVYGTLKKGFGNHVLLEDAKFVREGITDTPFVMYSNWFPYIIPMNYPLSDEEVRSSGRVKGEVYEVNEEQLRSLDGLEGEGHFYQRVRLEVSGELVSGYQMMRDNHNIYKDGYELVKPNGNRILEWVE